MANPKILITAGCSFTQVPNWYDNWPLFLDRKIGFEKTHFDGAGSAGNDLIARRVIFRVTQCLADGYDPDDLLVGVMWSGVLRKSFYFSDPVEDYYNVGDLNEWHFANPQSVGGSSREYIIAPNIDDKLSEIYYTKFFDDIGEFRSTLEHVLRVQWFLQQYKIKYFFTNFHTTSFADKPYTELYDHVDIHYLYKQIDQSNFLPVKHMGFYNENIANLKYEKVDDNHPTSEMSEKFCDDIIIPHLKNKGYIE